MSVGAEDFLGQPGFVQDQGRSRRQGLPTMKAFLFLLISTAVCLAASEPSKDTRWEIITSGPVSVPIPNGWRNFDGMQPSLLIFRQGDGITFPMFDEAGQPLQMGITVEKFAATTDSTETIAQKTAEGASRDPRLKPVGDDSLESVVLSDQTKGTFLIKEFIKSTHRRSLQMKLFIKDADATSWVISGYIVGGKDSPLPTRNSRLAVWIRAHLLSATLTKKAVDTKALDAAYDATKAIHPIDGTTNAGHAF